MSGIHIAHQDAVEAMKNVFGTLPFSKTKTWGWIVELRVWDFRITISAMAGDTRALFEQQNTSATGTVFIAKRNWDDISHPDKLIAIMREVKAEILGIALVLFQFCGEEQDAI